MRRWLGVRNYLLDQPLKRVAPPGSTALAPVSASDLGPAFLGIRKGQFHGLPAIDGDTAENLGVHVFGRGRNKLRIR